MGLVKGPPKRGLINKLDSDGTPVIYLEFQFNPGSIRRTIGAAWTLTIPPGGFLPIPMYGQGQGETLNFELFLDSREDGNRKWVINQLAFLESLARPNVQNDDVSLSEFTAPPLCQLCLGNRVWWMVVNRVDITEEMFDLDLNPIRARVAIDASVVFVDVEQSNQLLTDMIVNGQGGSSGGLGKIGNQAEENAALLAALQSAPPEAVEEF